MKDTKETTRYIFIHSCPRPITKFDVIIARIALGAVYFTIGLVIAFAFLLAIIF